MSRIVDIDGGPRRYVVGPLTISLEIRERPAEAPADPRAGILADARVAGGGARAEVIVVEIDLLRALRDQGSDPDRDGERGARAMRSRVKAYIEDHLGDPALSSPTIARAHYISTRYLQKLFKAEGATVSGWIRERRLAGALRDLRDPARAGESITSIAARWGLHNSAHFSRAFRAHYGRTPSEARAEALGRS